MSTYKIVRTFQDPNRSSMTVRGKTGLTLEEAQYHCSDPETNSKTATRAVNRRYTAKVGPWFDGYDVEKKTK